MLKAVYNTDSKKKNNDLVNLIKSGLMHLKYGTEEKNENEIEMEKPNKIVDNIENVLDFKNQNKKT